MKKQLLGTISEIIELLAQCNWEDRADWFRSRMTVIRELNPTSDEFRQELLALRAAIAGMGSFTDLPLYPRAESNLTLEQAGHRQWDLAEKLGRNIEDLLDSA